VITPGFVDLDTFADWFDRASVYIQSSRATFPSRRSRGDLGDADDGYRRDRRSGVTAVSTGRSADRGGPARGIFAIFGGIRGAPEPSVASSEAS